MRYWRRWNLLLQRFKSYYGRTLIFPFVFLFLFLVPSFIFRIAFHFRQKKDVIFKKILYIHYVPCMYLLYIVEETVVKSAFPMKDVSDWSDKRKFFGARKWNFKTNVPALLRVEYKSLKIICCIQYLALFCIFKRTISVELINLYYRLFPDKL